MRERDYKRLRAEVASLSNLVMEISEDVDRALARLEEQIRRVRQATVYPPAEASPDLLDEGGPRA